MYSELIREKWHDYMQELMSAAKERQTPICFGNPSVVESHLCKLPYMEISVNCVSDLNKCLLNIYNNNYY